MERLSNTSGTTNSNGYQSTTQKSSNTLSIRQVPPLTTLSPRASNNVPSAQDLMMEARNDESTITALLHQERSNVEQLNELLGNVLHPAQQAEESSMVTRAQASLEDPNPELLQGLYLLTRAAVRIVAVGGAAVAADVATTGGSSIAGATMGAIGGLGSSGLLGIPAYFIGGIASSVISSGVTGAVTGGIGGGLGASETARMGENLVTYGHTTSDATRAFRSRMPRSAWQSGPEENCHTPQVAIPGCAAGGIAGTALAMHLAPAVTDSLTRELATLGATHSSDVMAGSLLFGGGTGAAAGGIAGGISGIGYGIRMGYNVAKQLWNYFEIPQSLEAAKTSFEHWTGKGASDAVIALQEAQQADEALQQEIQNYLNHTDDGTWNKCITAIERPASATAASVSPEEQPLSKAQATETLTSIIQNRINKRAEIICDLQARLEIQRAKANAQTERGNLQYKERQKEPRIAGRFF